MIRTSKEFPSICPQAQGNHSNLIINEEEKGSILILRYWVCEYAMTDYE